MLGPVKVKSQICACCCIRRRIVMTEMDWIWTIFILVSCQIQFLTKVTQISNGSESVVASDHYKSKLNLMWCVWNFLILHCSQAHSCLILRNVQLKYVFGIAVRFLVSHQHLIGVFL